MEEKEIYDNLYRKSISIIETGQNKYDSILEEKRNDNRFGLTLRLRPNKEIIERIADFQKELIKIDSHQYYQPVEDLHLTAMAIIACKEGFTLDDIPIEDRRV